MSTSQEERRPLVEFVIGRVRFEMPKLTALQLMVEAKERYHDIARGTVLVFARNHKEAYDYCRVNEINPKFVSLSVERISSAPTDSIVYLIGRYWDHIDYRDVVDCIRRRGLRSVEIYHWR